MIAELPLADKLHVELAEERMRRYITSLMLSAALLAPIALRADDHDHDKEHRYYDKSGKDWHHWDDREDKAYRHYLEEQHREYRDFGKANRHDQEAYWKWRHSHPE